MYFTYDKVKNDIWDIIKDKTDFVYEPSSDCRVCEQHNEWEFDPEEFGEEPPLCKAHYDGDACRYFYEGEKGYSDYNAPACVVGNWFVHNKFTQEELNVSTWEQLEGQGVKTILNKSNFDLDDEAMEFINLMQTHQDTGMSWGNAFEQSVAKLEATTVNDWQLTPASKTEEDNE
jgi:hypothetical protein